MEMTKQRPLKLGSLFAHTLLPITAAMEMAKQRPLKLRKARQISRNFFCRDGDGQTAAVETFPLEPPRGFFLVAAMEMAKQRPLKHGPSGEINPVFQIAAMEMA